MSPSDSRASGGGLSIAPFRALRYRDSAHLGQLLSPPYDVIDADERRELIERDPSNVVRLILPVAPGGDAPSPSTPDPLSDRSKGGGEPADPYAEARRLLDSWLVAGPSEPVLQVDDAPALYVYEMRSDHGVTRGLIGAVELRDPDDGVILPHENVMAGPVADRLALMEATDANLEPIYLVYPGGGAASEVVAGVEQPGSTATEVARATTPDGVAHRLWATTDPAVHAAVASDLAQHSAVIADGHHRYATYRELQRRRRETAGAGPWDRGLTLLVDTSQYGAQVEAIHRVLRAMPLAEAVGRLQRPPAGVDDLTITSITELAAALHDLHDRAPEATTTVVLADRTGAVLVEGLRAPGTDLGSDLDVVAVHRDLIERRLGLPDTVDAVQYAHDVDGALHLADVTGGTAVLLRPTPVEAVMTVARGGGRMPRKSTLFVPKPASGLVMRRFADQL